MKDFYVINTNHINLLSGTAAIDLKLIALADETKQKNENNNENKQYEASNNVEIVSEKESKPIQKSESFEQPCAEIKNETPIRLEPLVNNYKDTLFSKNNRTVYRLSS